ncbi:MAG: radical SAM protein [Candidatus Tritonobacter lacicola]|nr:radical SAM protein [Candidatus Tritonobacter lacicola]
MNNTFCQAVSRIGPFIKAKRNLLPLHIGSGGWSFRPVTIYLSVNSSCNLRCGMCDVGLREKDSQFYKHLKTGDELSLPRIKGLVDEVAHFRPAIAAISTEPLLYDGIIELASHVKARGLDFHLTTNGFLLPDFADEIARAGVDTLWVSLDGDEETHDRIRGVRGSFGRAVEGIERVAAAAPGIKILVNCTISHYNYPRLVQFVEAIPRTLIKNLVFSHLNYVTDKMAEAHNRLYLEVGRATPMSVSGANPKDIKPEVLFGQIEEIKRRLPGFALFAPDLKTAVEMDDFYNRPGKILAKNYCPIPWTVSQVIANGDVIPLTRCFDVVLGNIYRQSFAEIWRGEKMQRFRRALKKQGLFPVCTRCCGSF